MNEKLKILIFCEPKSVHSRRWVGQFVDTGWEIKVVSPVPPNWNFWLKNVQKDSSSNQYPSIEFVQIAISPWLKFLALVGKGMLQFKKIFKSIMLPDFDRFYSRLASDSWQKNLEHLVTEFQPDVVHSLAINSDWRNICLPVLRMKEDGVIMAPWIYSSWGTDLTFYPELSPQIQQNVEKIIRTVDYYIAECNRDYLQAVKFGLQGKYLGAFPAFGGIHIKQMLENRQNGNTSDRNKIYFKGRGEEDPVGMAMHILDALVDNRPLLTNIEIMIGQATPSIIKRAQEIKEQYNLNIIVLPYAKNPDDVLKYMGSSRVFISYTKNDGLPASLIESMTLGAFPIFSRLSSIEEWIEDDKNGSLVDVDKPEKLTEAIREALKDDELVNKVSSTNLDIVKQRMDFDLIRQKVINMYQQVVQESKNR